MKFRVLSTAILTLLLLGAAGCKEKGPMEKAGEKLDNAAEEVEKAAEEAVEELKDDSDG